MRGVRGATSAEFVIVFVPFLMLFFATAQYSVLAVEKILTKHSAFLAVRAAIVACTEPGAGDDAMKDIDNAAAVAFGPALKLGRPSAKVTAGACDQTNQDLMTVTVSVKVKCSVPMGGLLVCGGPTKTLTASASMPNQGTYANAIWGGQ